MCSVLFICNFKVLCNYIFLVSPGSVFVVVVCFVHIRAAGSNLRMVRLSLMSVVKLLIICVRSARQKFGPWYF